MPGYCHSARVEQVLAFDGLLTPGRYVGISEGDYVDFDALHLDQLLSTLRQQFADGVLLQDRLLSLMEHVSSHDR